MESKYFSELLGAFAGDGWMSKGSSGISLFITGNPKNEKDYYDKRIKFLFKKVFGVKVFPRLFPYWGTYGICVGKKSVIKAFIDAGMIVGKKVHKVKVPHYIINNQGFYVSFARGLFDTDGCVYFKKSYNKNASVWQKQNKHKIILKLVTVSPRLAKQLKEIFLGLGLKFRLRKMRIYNGTHFPYELLSDGKANAVKFFKIIQPKNKKHISKFEYWLSQGFYSHLEGD